MCKHKSKVNREDKCNIHRRKVFSLMNRKHSRNARKLIQNWRLITYKNFLRRGEVGDELKLPAMTHSSEDSPEVEALNEKLMRLLYGADGARESGNEVEPVGGADLEILGDDEKIITTKKQRINYKEALSQRTIYRNEHQSPPPLKGHKGREVYLL